MCKKRTFGDVFFSNVVSRRFSITLDTQKTQKNTPFLQLIIKTSQETPKIERFFGEVDPEKVSVLTIYI